MEVTQRFVPLQRYVRLCTTKHMSQDSEPLAVATGEVFFDRQTGEVGMVAPDACMPLRELAKIGTPWGMNLLFGKMTPDDYLSPVLTAPTREELVAEICEGGRLEEYATYHWGLPYLMHVTEEDIYASKGEDRLWYAVLEPEDAYAFSQDWKRAHMGLGATGRDVPVFDEGRFDPDIASAGSGMEDGIAVVVTRMMRTIGGAWRTSGVAGMYIGWDMVRGNFAHCQLADLGFCREARNMGVVGAHAPIREFHFAQAQMPSDISMSRVTMVPTEGTLAWGFGEEETFNPDGVFVNVELAYHPSREPLEEASLEMQRNWALRAIAEGKLIPIEPIAYVRTTQRKATGAHDIGAHISCCPMSDMMGSLGDLTPYPYERWHFPTPEEIYARSEERWAKGHVTLGRWDWKDETNQQIATRRFSDSDKGEPQRDWGKSILNPDIAQYLFRHRDGLDLTDEHDLDLVEYVAWQRDTANSSVARRIAERMYGMLPEERQAVIDGRINEYYGWDRSANRYFLLRRLMEQEMDADALEDAVLGDNGDAWVHNFALARLTGWSTYQEEDRMSFLTFECKRLDGYTEERRKRFLAKMVGEGRISLETVAKLLDHAPSDSI